MTKAHTPPKPPAANTGAPPAPPPAAGGEGDTPNPPTPDTPKEGENEHAEKPAPKGKVEKVVDGLLSYVSTHAAKLDFLGFVLHPGATGTLNAGEMANEDLRGRLNHAEKNGLVKKV